MQKFNELGIELQSLKQELLKTDYPEVVKKALSLSATNMVNNKLIDVDLHLGLTNEKMNEAEFEQLLAEAKDCLKTEAEMLVEFEKVRESLQAALLEKDENTLITSKSLVETDQVVFSKTFMLDKQWVSDYFGQPADEVGKLMVRNGFVEKFAVLRLGKILESFLKSDEFFKNEDVECKATRVFYDVDQDYYGIHIMFYLSIEKAEDPEISTTCLDYVQAITDKATEYVEERMKL